ncbi:MULTISPECIES: tryptophan 2,3-dioxygenase family protein [unclassified Streptomyces]|uniref:tryptophan 2,3-dioxygenase family protein n=1 Tax=unclassified Streptomyces TaxID=2593676 RepID=UPI0007C56CD6|nr:tryptophan 2,3-dioxygenase family protein [Streptomyces sp. NRRL F-2747]
MTTQTTEPEAGAAPAGKDYSVPVLPGTGDTDYARYMRTDTLLSLQRRPEEVIHRDELLFQVVHQSTELWLKLACQELTDSTRLIGEGSFDTAVRLLERARLGVRLATDQLEMMRRLSPWDFQTIRTILGHGSGFESPGWAAARRATALLGEAFDRAVEERGIDLAEVYRTQSDTPVHRLAEALIGWDEGISLWRVEHCKMALRLLGEDVLGTKGIPIGVLTKLIGHQFFPRLWLVRTELTRTGPMGDAAPAAPTAPPAAPCPAAPLPEEKDRK